MTALAPKTIGLYPYPIAATLLEISEIQLRKTAEGLGFTKRYLSVSELVRVWVLLKPFCICFRPRGGRRAEQQECDAAQQFLLAHGGILTPNLAQLRFATKGEAVAFIDRFDGVLSGTELLMEVHELGPAWHIGILTDMGTDARDA